LQIFQQAKILTLSAERYDFVLNANQNMKNYWITVRGKGFCMFKRVFQTAVLNYEGVDVNASPDGPAPRYQAVQAPSHVSVFKVQLCSSIKHQLFRKGYECVAWGLKWVIHK
jgi:hypothetical protein